MNAKEIHDYLLDFPNSWIDFPFGEDMSVYKTGDKTRKEGKIYAILAHNKKPLQISLKCDPLLAEKLRNEYESVLPGYHLNKKHWNTIILSGQVDDTELKSLMMHSYQLVSQDADSKA